MRVFIGTALCLLVLSTTIQAAITTTGDIYPATDPSTWTSSTTVYIGRTSDGTISVDNGDILQSKNGHIAYVSGTEGEVTITGSGSTWNASGSIFIGEDGEGALNIADGGQVICNSFAYLGFDSAASAGTLNVDGSNSTWTSSTYFYVGYGGNGELNITNGGTFNVVYSCVLGHESNSLAEVNVSGTNSTLNSQFVNVGHLGGNATLNITNGGQINNQHNAYIGQGTGTVGVVTVDGADSAWTLGNNLQIGYFGIGTLNITNGATVTNTFSHIGNRSGSIGTVTIGEVNSTSENTATWTNSGIISIGIADIVNATSAGTGTLNIYDQGLVQAAGLAIGEYGTLNLDGGTLELTDDMDFYDWDGTFDFTSGEIKVSSGTITAYAAMTLNNDQLLTVTGSSSAWTNNSGLGMYVHGGELMVDNGGTVSSSHGVVGGSFSSTATAMVDGSGSTWTNSGNLSVGYFGTGSLSITDGASVSSTYGYVGLGSGSTGTVTVDGDSSTWTNTSSTLYVGYEGTGTLNVTDGGEVEDTDGYIGYFSGSTGSVVVNGADSTWTNSDDLVVGKNGTGTLDIINGGLVSVAGTLTIDNDNDADSFIYMSDDGMLAVYGDADESLSDFLADLVSGTDAIQWYDSTDEQWELLTTATEGTDYLLAYIDDTANDLYGYTLLTVMADGPVNGRAMFADFGDLGDGAAVPEPGTVGLILTALATLGVAVIRKRGNK